MPISIVLTTVPGTLEQGRGYVMQTADLFGPSLDTERIAVQRTADIAPAVRRFRERVRTLHPDASFKVLLLRIAKGDRKPSGYDAAQKAGGFGQDAFMRMTESRETTRASFKAAETSASEQPQGARPLNASTRPTRTNCRRSATSATSPRARPC